MTKQSGRESLVSLVCWRVAWKLNERPLNRWTPRWLSRSAHEYIFKVSSDRG